MAKKGNKPSQNQRIEEIRGKLLDGEEVSIEKLARRFGVSGMTVRRDLEVLESQGDVIRTHGGATPAKRLTFEFSFRNKQNKNIEQKRRIARQAVKHVRDGRVIMLDTGTTTLQIAEELTGKENITIITTSLAIVSKVQFAPNVEVVLLGGFLRGGSPDLHGPLTEQNVELFRTDVAFMGADAVDSIGNTYTDDLRVANLDKKMAANAKKVIVVADSSKFGRTAMCKVFGCRDYDLVITDKKIDKEISKQLTRKKVKLELA